MFDRFVKRDYFRWPTGAQPIPSVQNLENWKKKN